MTKQSNMAGRIRELLGQLDQCMVRDRHRLRQRLQRLQRDRARSNRDDLSRIADDVAASAERRRCRAASTPAITYPSDLPVVARRDDIAAAIADHQVVVVCGETGSGKTTQLPKICLELGRGVAGVIGHTQPRRIAARSVAARIADELGVGAVGSDALVGVKVRFQDQTGDATRIKVMTDGILLAETQRDRFLDQYDTLIIDEAHERSLNIDFLLGYLRQLLVRRRDLKVIITSATIDPERFSKHFSDAPIIEVSGRTYPVEVRYRPLAADDPDEAAMSQMQAIAAAVDEVMTDTTGDVLIFQSGEREIRETARVLRGRLGDSTSGGVEILPLYARLPAHEQQRIFAQRHHRRIVIATNVAETSLTVPGITAVIDPGEARISRYSARSKVQRLLIEPISQASADQRAGRCGRIAPGVCVRLYSEADYNERDAYTQPEIQRTNLASVILQMRALRLGDIERFPFIDPPKTAMIRDGLHTLRELSAIDQDSALTDIGRTLARLPVDPRIGRMLLAAHDNGCLREVLVIGAALTSQDPRLRPLDAQQRADEAHQRIAPGESDFLSMLALWHWLHEQKGRNSWNQLRRICHHTFLSFTSVREWLDVHRQLRELALEAGLTLNRSNAEPDDMHQSILAGLLANVGRRGEGYEYVGTHNTTFHLHPGSILFDDKPQWVMAAERVETTRRYARTVARIQPQWIEPLAMHVVSRSYSEPHWNEKSAQVMAFEKVSLYGLEIVSRRRVPFGPIDPKISRELFIHHALVEGEYRTNAPFFAHNRELIAEIERVEAKRRKRDVLVDPSVRYAFYDARIPTEVVSGATFDKWRKKSEKSHPRLLFMTREDLLRDDAGQAAAEQFPDHLRIGDARLTLTYRHEPGHDADGVSVTVPRAMLSQIPPDRLEWLVPGMLREKIIALIKALPKRVRTSFVPAPDFADAVLGSLHEPAGPLADAVGRELTRMTGIEIPRDAWSKDLCDPHAAWALPLHLYMHICVVDEQGKTVASGRDLAALQSKLAGDRNAAGQDRTASLPPELARDRVTTLDIAALPGQITTTMAGVPVRGYPALVDNGTSVSVRMFDRSEQAQQHHRAGVRRLLAIALDDELSHHLDHLPGLDDIKRYAFSVASMSCAGPVSARDVLADLGDLVVDRACIGDADVPRDAAGLEAACERGRQRLWDEAVAQARLAEDVLGRIHQIALTLEADPPDAWRASLDDVRRQIAKLIPKQFLTQTHYGWLLHLPRYLQGIESRLRKLRDGGVSRDHRQMDTLSPWLRDFEERASDHAKRDIKDPMLEYFGWLLEEYRIALFAQELGTALPISPKRLDEAWAQVQR